MAGRESLLALRSRVSGAQERTQDAHQAVQQRRQERRQRGEQQAERAEVPTFVVGGNVGQNKQRPVTSSTVRTWFYEGLQNLYGSRLTLPAEKEWWTRAEQSLAKKLLSQYGPELVQKAVAHFCQTWPQRVEAANGRLGGIPGIRLLWVARDRVFAEAQGVTVLPQQRRTRPARSKLDFGEYTPGKRVGIGWEK